MLRSDYIYYPLQFKRPGGTSRGVLHTKKSWLIRVWDDSHPDKKGVGECSIIDGLSIDDVPEYDQKLADVCQTVETVATAGVLLDGWPSIRFGLETALHDLRGSSPFILYPSPFTEGRDSIPINGLIWMGEAPFMKAQIREKLEAGFGCLKLKIGALDFQNELEILKEIRREYAKSDLELRVDANGAFSPSDAAEKLKRLAELDLHSIEQPVRAGQTDCMALLCRESPLPIALDEELIGITSREEMQGLLKTVQPRYIILKPALLGGIHKAEEWIACASQLSIGWWVTSALESNIGLNAIAQWTYSLKSAMIHGLGTGSLYTNNIPSPLTLTSDRLSYDPQKPWQLG
ncbi:o-succinylbenzoate synthase [bacterium]|nr:o-succinylbenzoate synthase [bacterium]